MTRREQLGIGSTGIWNDLIDGRDEDWREIVGTTGRAGRLENARPARRISTAGLETQDATTAIDLV